MPVSLPKSPNLETQQMLIRANHFLTHAKQHATLDNEFDKMIAIHNLDNTIEYLLRILIRHLEIEENTGKTIDSAEIAHLIGEIQKYIKEQYNLSLSYVTEIKLIRTLRNMVQHAMTLPLTDLKTYLDYGDRFFERTLTKFFGMTLENLKYSSLIRSDPIKSFLKQAEDKIEENCFLESIIACRNAFDYACFIYINDSLHRIERAPALCELKKTSFSLYGYLKTLDREVSLNISNIDVNQYLRYSQYIECIPYEYQADWHGNTVLSRPWEKADAEFCYFFVANSILQLEMHENKPIQSHSQFDLGHIEFIETIGGVDIDVVFPEYGCSYLGDMEARLFYCTKETVERFKSILTHDYLQNDFKKIESDTLQIHRTEYIHVLAYDINLIMNNPPTWEVIIVYHTIQFTSQDMLSASNNICIDACDIDILLKAGVTQNDAEIILAYTQKNGPLNTSDNALELKNLLKNSDDLVRDNYISNILIESINQKCSQ